MARPPMKTENKRSLKFTFRLNEKEVIKLDLLAEQCGETAAYVVREKLFKGEFPVPKTPLIDSNTYLELKKIGVNLNQIAKQVNSGILPTNIYSKLNDLLNQQRTIINLLLNDSKSENR